MKMPCDTISKRASRRRNPRCLVALMAGLLAGLCGISARAQQAVDTADLFADTWVATDGLGRTLPGADTCGAPRPGKTVALFYWTWHIRANGASRDPLDNSRITTRALIEGKPAEWPSFRANHFWGEPELGYYLSNDPFVARRHASLLADAGVDVLVFDTTNPPWTWKEAYMALAQEFTAMRQEGNRTPDIAFMCPFGDPSVVVKRVVDELYGPGLYRDLWFMWDDRPLILANPRHFRDIPEILNLFTFRQPIPGYWTRPSAPGQWPWLQVFPQYAFPNSAGDPEVVAVGVAQNAITGARGPAPMSHKQGAMGRSWHDGARDPDPAAIDLGLNFKEQWDRAMALDPQVVFVTGWNEWTAIRLPTFGPYNEREHPYHRRGLFIDQYNREYSRDCEPMKGGHEDAYYYQLTANIRRFKGVRPPPQPGGPSTIRVDGQLEDWLGVTPTYRDTIGDTSHRQHQGYGERVYTNDTGRNDIVRCKVAYDSRNVYFLAETRQPLTAATDRNWMLLFVDADQDPTTGWEGYDLLVNETRHADGTATILRIHDATSTWEDVGRAALGIGPTHVELAVDRALLGVPEGETPALDFHWADNIQRLAIQEFGINGDSAPNRRSKYRYGTQPASAATPPLGYFGEAPDAAASTEQLAPDELVDMDGASWIWHQDIEKADHEAPLGAVRFRCTFTASPAMAAGKVFLVAASDNQADIWLNDATLGAVSGWTPSCSFPVTLKPGENVLRVVVQNLGEEPNPAGLALIVGSCSEEGSTTVLARTGDEGWEASLGESGVWSKARTLVPVGGPPWGPVR